MVLFEPSQDTDMSETEGASALKRDPDFRPRSCSLLAKSAPGQATESERAYQRNNRGGRDNISCLIKDVYTTRAIFNIFVF